LAVTPDGAVLFRRTPPREFAADLYELDAKTGAIKTLLSVAGDHEHVSEAEKARRERTRTATHGVVDIDVSADGKVVMIPLGQELVFIDRGSGERRTQTFEGEMYDPHLSPDGTQVAFVRGGDLWVMSITRSDAKRLTEHGQGFELGIADFAAQEELGRT